VLIGVHREAVGHFIAGEATQQPKPIDAPKGGAKKSKPASPAPQEVREPEPPPVPIEGWKPLQTETVELNALDYKLLGVARRSTRMRVTIDASSAVFFGVFQQTSLQEYARARRLLRQNDFQQSKCGRIGIVKTEFECDLEEGDTLLLRDKRAEGSVFLGAFGMLKGNSQAASRATEANKVEYHIAEWGCVRNCDTGTR
jgi:hypothetical protein